MPVARQSLTTPEVLRRWESPKILRYDTAFLITLLVLIESVISNMAQESAQNLCIADNVNSFNVINVNTMISDEDNQMMEWLSPLKPQQRHQSVRADRLDGVGDWFLETSEFREWSNAEDGSFERVLFCFGGPGVGKNTLLPEKGMKEDITDKDKKLVP